MAKKKKNKINGGFFQTTHELWDSKPFRELNVHARYLYTEFERKFNGNNGNNLKLTHKEARTLMSINTFTNARDQLIEKGFIDVYRRGGLWKQAAIYGFSNRWRKYGTSEFEKITIKGIAPPIAQITNKNRTRF
jgi:hypothetical protein